MRLLLLAVLAAGLAAWRLTRPQPPEPPRWIEDDDGIQPADPWTTALANGTVAMFDTEHGWTLA